LFPLDISGTIDLAPLDPRHVASVLDAIQRRLEAEPVSSIGRDVDAVVFGQDLAQMFSLAAYGAFGFVDSGEVRVESKPATLLEYRLSTRRSLMVIMGLTSAMALFIALSEGDLSTAVSFVALGFSWLFGMNYLIAMYRTRRVLTELVAPARSRASGTGPRACPHCGVLYDPSDYRPGVEMMCERCHESMGANSA